jgi:hypothetical protein
MSPESLLVAVMLQETDVPVPTRLGFCFCHLDITFAVQQKVIPSQNEHTAWLLLAYPLQDAFVMHNSTYSISLSR